MAVVNKFETATWLCMEGLDSLLNELCVARQFNSDFNSEFTKPFPVGATVQVPLPFRPKIRTGMHYLGQNIERTHTSITVDQPFGVDLEWNSIEKALEMSRGKEKVRREYLDPSFKKVAQEIESRAALYAYQNTACIVGQLGTNPNTFDAVFGAAGQYMTEQGISGDKKMILAPAVHRGLRAVAINQFNPTDAVSRMFKKGIIGTVNDFETYESASLYDHQSGVWAAPAALPTVFGAGQSGSNLVVTATAGDTFLKGDVFCIPGVFPINAMTGRRSSSTRLKQFRLTADYTAVGGAGADTLPIAPAIVGPGQVYQNVDALPLNGVLLQAYPGTTLPSGQHGMQSLAMTREAYALVGVPLEVPTAEEWAGQARDPETGIQVAFFRSFDPIDRRWITRLDLLIGFGTFYADEGACIRVLGA